MGFGIKFLIYFEPSHGIESMSNSSYMEKIKFVRRVNRPIHDLDKT
jgi:hypothetical protein